MTVKDLVTEFAMLNSTIKIEGIDTNKLYASTNEQIGFEPLVEYYPRRVYCFLIGENKELIIKIDE